MERKTVSYTAVITIPESELVEWLRYKQVLQHTGEGLRCIGYNDDGDIEVIVDGKGD